MSEYPIGSRVRLVNYGKRYDGLEGTVRNVFHRDSTKAEPYHDVHLDNDPDAADMAALGFRTNMILCYGNELELIA